MIILIADDEYLIRVSLRNSLLKMGVDGSYIHEATDGAETVQALKELQPDIAFVDIKMPVLTGLEAIAQGRLLSPDTEFVILTGFAEFEFAKKALQLHVRDYLLKPVTFEKLLSLMQEIIQDIHVRALQESDAFISRMAALISNNLEIRHSRDAELTCRLIYICLDRHSEGNDDQERLKAQIRACAAKYVSRRFYAGLLLQPHQDWSLICAYDSSAENNATHKPSGFMAEIKNMAQMGLTGIRFTLITGPPHSFKKLPEQLGKMKELSCLRSILGIHGIYTVSVLESFYHQYPDLLEPAKMLIRFARCHQENRLIEAHQLLENMRSLWDRLFSSDNSRMIQAIVTFLNHSIGFPQVNYNRYERLLSDLNEHVNMILRGHANKTSLADSIKEYTLQNFTKNISIADIASLFGVSPNYASTVFHKAFGRKFVEYVTELRMQEAKKLLLETDLSIHDITRKVGYYSMSHFSKLFYKYNNKTPLEYKKLLHKPPDRANPLSNAFTSSKKKE